MQETLFKTWCRSLLRKSRYKCK